MQPSLLWHTFVHAVCVFDTVQFYLTNGDLIFWASVSGITACILSWALWKSRQLPVNDKSTFFISSYARNTTSSRNRLKLTFPEGSGSGWIKNLGWRGRTYQGLLVSECSTGRGFIRFVTMHTSDKQTDGHHSCIRHIEYSHMMKITLPTKRVIIKKKSLIIMQCFFSMKFIKSSRKTDAT